MSDGVLIHAVTIVANMIVAALAIFSWFRPARVADMEPSAAASRELLIRKDASRRRGP